MRILIALFIFCFPFINAFAFTSTINLDIVLGFSILVIVPFSKYIKYKINNLDLFVFLFYIIITISFFVNSSSINSRYLNHYIAWSTTLLLFYFTIGLVIKCLKIEYVFKILVAIYSITLFFIVLEFVLYNFFLIDIQKFIPRVDRDHIYDATFLFLLRRPRCFFSEPGYAAMFIAIIFPIISYYFKYYINSRFYYNVLIILTIIASLLLFSTTFFIFFPVVIIIATFFYRTRRFLLYFHTSFLLLVPLLIFYYSTILTILDIAILGKFETGSMGQRVADNSNSILLTINSGRIYHILLGYGTGYYDYLNQC